MELVTLADIEAARHQLTDVIRTTPLLDSGPLEAKVGGPAFLKCENLQRAGSFKIRGAFVRIARLSDAERKRGVVAASAGNHAQGVALAARLLGTNATVFMPKTAQLPKVAATKAYGAEVHFSGEVVDDALVAARAFADDMGAVFIHPFDHPDVIAGQGTVGLEILEQCPDVGTILVGVGGGGLIAGIAAAVREKRPQVRIVGVQAQGAAAMPVSLKAGQPTRIDTVRTIADGIAVGCPGDLTFAHVASLVDDVVTVSDDTVSRALLFCLERTKMVVEPAGAVTVAAVLDEPRLFPPPVVAVLSGGNIDPMLMLRIIEHGMSAAGRYLNFTVRTIDRPGSLATLLRIIADKGVNVVDVAHIRRDSRLGMGDADIALSVETRGTEHSERLIALLRGLGYTLAVN